MAITFDGANKRVVLDTANISASQIWTDWIDWLAADTYNHRWLPTFRQTGGDELGDGLFIPVYIFLLNGWRIRPMETSHTLIITGNLFVEGGGVPVVQTLGSYNVSVQYTVPVQAQGISTSGGGGGGLTTEQETMLRELWKLGGLDNTSPLSVSRTARSTGGISQTITRNTESGEVTVLRNP